MPEAPFDDKVSISIDGAVGIHFRNDPVSWVDGILSVYLCGACDATHFGIQIGDMVIGIAMRPKMAEEIARRLINPHPVSKEVIDESYKD